MISQEELDQIFSKAVRDYIFHFNMLERNMGYSLNYISRLFDEYKNHKILSELPFCDKIKTIKKIVSDKSLTDQFESWFVAVDHCRKLRNFIVHGRCEVRWHIDKPIRFDSTNMNVTDKSEAMGSFTVDEFLQELQFLKNVAENFNNLRKTYEY